MLAFGRCYVMLCYVTVCFSNERGWRQLHGRSIHGRVRKDARTLALALGGRLRKNFFFFFFFARRCGFLPVTVVSVALGGGARTVSIPKSGKTKAGFYR